MFLLLNFTSSIIFYIIGMVLILVFLLGSAIISGIEVAYFSLTTKELANFKESQNINENRVVKLIESGPFLLATFIIINNLFNISFIICSTYMLWQYFGKDNISNSLMISFTIITSIFIIIFGELIPKMYSNYFRLTISKKFSWMANFLVNIMKPLSRPMIKIGGVFGKNFTPEKYILSEHQLERALEITMRNIKDNSMNISEKKILTNIVKFGNLYVKQVMIPRGQIIAVDFNLNYGKLIDLILNSNFSRLPVYKGNIDNIFGIIYAKDFLQYIDKPKEFKWHFLIKKPFFIPENKKLDSLLVDFKEEKIHMAIIIDEYGGTSGLITMEDLVKRIIGDVNSQMQIQNYKKINTKTYVFDGKTTLADFCRITNIPLPVFDDIKGESESLGGLILEINGNLPNENQNIIFKNFNFIILSVDSRKINKIKIEIKNNFKY